MSSYAVRVMILFFLSANVANCYRKNVAATLASKSARSSYAGYLIRSGDSLSFRWSNKPIDGALAKVSPAEGVIEKLTRWGRLGAATPIKRPVATSHQFCEGMNSFLRHARKNGVMVTLLKPVAKVGLYYGDNKPAAFPAVGQSFNIGEVQVVGSAEPDTNKLDDLPTMSQLTRGIFTGAFIDARVGGATLDISKLPVLKPAANAGSESASVDITAGKVAGEAPEPTTLEVKEEPTPQAGQGCYLLLLRRSAGSGATSYELAQMYSKEAPKGAVAFFKPSESKVPANSWKYTRGKRVLMHHTISSSDAHRQVTEYYQKWVSFLNEARKMEGQFEILPISDENKAFETQVLFQEAGDGSMTIIRATVGEPVDLSKQRLVAVINARNEKKVGFFEGGRSMPAGILMREVKDGGDGFVGTWGS
jgi:hypothetical protein